MPGIGERGAHGASGAVGRRLGDVKRVRRHAEADDFAENRRATGARGVERLQHQHGGAFAQDQAAPVLRKRTAGVGRDHAHGLPRFEESETEDGLASAGDGHGRGAAPHHPKSLSDGVIGRGAGGGNGVGGPHHAGLERDAAGGGVFHGARNGERIHARDVVAIEIDEALVLGGLAADAGAGDDGGGFAQFAGSIAMPAAAMASRAAITPNCAKRSSRPISFSSKYCAGAKFRTSAPFEKRSSAGSTAWSGPMPERPAWSDCQNSPLLSPMRGDDAQAGDSHPARHVRR